MGHFGIILALVTLATCFQQSQAFAERLKSLELLSKATSDFYLNGVKAGGLRERLDRDAQANGTTNRTLITSMAFQTLPQPRNDLISKQSNNPFVIAGLESMFSRPRNGEIIPPLPTKKTTYMRPGLRQDILSVFNTPKKNDGAEVMTSGSGMPSPAADVWDIERTSRIAATPKKTKPNQKPKTRPNPPAQFPLSIYNTPIISKPVDQIPAYDNEVFAKMNQQPQTTVNVKSIDPAPPTEAKGMVSIEKLISKQDELFGLILQYHTEVNKLITDILAKIDSKGP